MHQNEYLITKNNLLYVKGSSHRVSIPNLNKKLALFLGLLWGDGWLLNRNIAKTNGNWRIGLVEDDLPLINNFALLVEDLFRIKPKLCDRITKIEVYFNSRIVYDFLNLKFNFPDGEKIGKLRVPKQILFSKRCTLAFLSGLFSTDGSFTLYKGYPRIQFDSATFEFVKEVESILTDLDFNPRFYTYNRSNGNKLYGIHLNGVKQVCLFNKLIGFIGEKANKLANFILACSPVV